MDQLKIFSFNRKKNKEVGRLKSFNDNITIIDLKRKVILKFIQQSINIKKIFFNFFLFIFKIS